MMQRFTVRLGFACAMVLAADAAMAHEQLIFDPPAEGRFVPYSGSLPPCNYWRVLSEITNRFAGREVTYWGSGLEIVNVDEIHEIGHRTNGPTYIPRRYCAARGDFNDGVSRGISYEIGESLGFAGVGWGVKWCVVGLDRDRAYAPRCKMVGP
jgi:hypothetical protein